MFLRDVGIYRRVYKRQNPEQQHQLINSCPTDINNGDTFMIVIKVSNIPETKTTEW